MNYIEEYYSNYDEDGRLLSRHGQVEYLTTMKYIHEYLGEDKSKRILEAGAGTGRYSVTLAKERYRVDAVELTTHNLSILRSKLTGEENLTAIQGNVLDLSMYEDNTFDLTLVLGPMYHLYCDEDRVQALREAVRVTKPGGHILVAYCMNESVVIQEAFLRGGIKGYMEQKMFTEDFHCLSEPEDLFAMVRIEEIHKYTEKLGITRLKTVATDGATNYMRSTVDAMDDETFDYYMKYHLCTCERQDLIGASNHSLDILEKTASTHNGTRELSTKRLRLRQFRISDATHMYKNYATDERVTKFLSWKPYKNVEGVKAYLSDVISTYSDKNTFHWAIEFKHEVIGSISTLSIDEKNRCCEIGYCIGYDYWNMGITSEALYAVLSFLFNEVGMHRITAKHDPENPASGKVMKKCNMTYEGKLRKHYLHHDGTYSDALIYSILADDFFDTDE